MAYLLCSPNRRFWETLPRLKVEVGGPVAIQLSQGDHRPDLGLVFVLMDGLQGPWTGILQFQHPQPLHCWWTDPLQGPACT